MRILRPAAALLTAGLLAAGLLAACSGPSQHGAAPRGTTSGTATGPGHAAAAASTATLTAANAPVPLVSGGQAQITQTGGQPSVSVKPAIVDGKPASSATTTFNVGGDTYAIPGNAMPYLGTLLDPRLFDVSYLQRAGYSKLPALPVTITWRHASHSAVPGITSAAHGTTTSGTVSSGARLGAALSAAIEAAHGAPNVQGPLAQVKRISLAPLPATATSGATVGSAPSSPEAAPAVPLSSTQSQPGKVYGLTVTVLGRDGQPSTDAVVAIQNLDSFNAYHSVTAVSTGQVSVSVPAGPYAIEAYAQTDGSFGAFFPEAVSLVTAQATVGSNSQVTLDARTAKPVTAQVPDTGAAALMATMQFVRRSADGNGLSVADQMYGSGLSTLLTPVQFYATPAPRPRLGSLGFADSWTFVPVGTGLASPDIPYSYFLNFASADGIPTALSHVVTAADLATVHESFPSTVDGNGDTFLVAPYNPWGLGTFWLFPDWIPFPAPTQRDDYYYGTPGTVWRQLAEGSAPPLDEPIPETAPFGPYVTYHPGEVTSDTWNGGPEVPQPQWQDMGVSDPTIGPLSGFHTDLSYPCPVCRQGQLMSFEAQESDGVPGHWDPVFGYGTGVVSSTTPGQGTDDLKFYANGVLTQESGFSSQIFPLLPGTATYAIDWTSARPDSVWSTLGTSVTSDWTFTSGPARSSKLPPQEYCSPSPMLSCTYLPLVFASYDFHDGLDGQVTAPGTETFTVTGYHEAGDNAPAVTQAKVQVSFDDGKTWTQAPATSLGGGQFRISVTQPDSTGFASVRVFLSDGAGDTLSQTIIHAWALAGASGTSGEGR